MKKHYEVDHCKNTCDNSIYLIDANEKRIFIETSLLDKQWLKSGQTLGMLRDTGNGLLIDLDEHAIELNYFEAELLRLLLKFNDPGTKLIEVTKKEIK